MHGGTYSGTDIGIRDDHTRDLSSDAAAALAIAARLPRPCPEADHYRPCELSLVPGCGAATITADY